MHTETIKRPPRTILEAFQGLPEGTLAQLIENNIVMSPSPLYRHQKVLNDINLQMALFVKKKDLGQVLVAPLDVHLDSKNIFQPDILFISNERLSFIEENGIHGAPDLIVEILSPSTARYDLKNKKKVYERYGVLEYWLVDPVTDIVQGFWLVNGKFQEGTKEKKRMKLRLLDLVIEF